MAKQADFTHIERAARTRRIAGKVVVYALLTAWALMVLFPFYWMILSSLKSYSAYNAEYIPKFYTLSPTLENYVEAFTAVPLGRYFANTLIFTVATTALMLIVVTLAAFAFARLNFRGRNIAFAAFLSLMMIPNELVIITNFVTITNLNLRNTFTGLILPSVTSVFYIYLLKENFAQVPDQLYYAAKVDGTSRRRIFARITVPLLSPMLAYVVITGFIGGFKEYTSIIGIFGEAMGPADAAGRLNTMVGFIYDALSTNNQGRASAAALILFGIILAVTLINLQVSKKRVHY